MEIHQVVVGASRGDAVTTQAREIQALLGGPRHSRIFARHIAPEIEGLVVPLARYPLVVPHGSRDDVIVYHASMGDPAVTNFLASRPERVVLVYHNITPSDYFQDIDPRFARLLDWGRSELTMLRDRVSIAFADSSYNARDLETMGYENVRVVPLILDFGRLQRLRPAASGQVGAPPSDEPLILSVGQLLPHKRPDLLIKAYEILVRYLEPRARLVMIGAPRVPSYARAIEQFALELNLPRLELLGSVDDAALVRWFEAADVFASMSEHEGFGIPLVEAMAFGCPVVTRRFAAIPETLGGAGLCLEDKDGPAVIAEALHAALRDESLRRDLIERGRRRAEQFDADAGRERFRTTLLECL